MGQKLVAFYEKARELGPRAKVTFVKQVALAASQAEALPDSPEMLKKFEDAYQKIKQEFG